MSAILIIEDDPKTAAAIRSGLIAEGYDAAVALDGSQGLAACGQRTYDAIVLDWMLPVIAGIDVLRTLRESGARIPVLLLTARDAIEDRIHGLDAGADDYLIKPFAFAELLARLRALLRRASDSGSGTRQVGDLALDIDARRARRGPRQIALTPREFDLLFYMMKHHDQPVTRRMLERDVWHDVSRATPLDNVIDVHIAHLRRKVDEDSSVKLIHTIRGVGFLLAERSRD
jgi:two-component system copper resistance phosphate regulon response regulator CusR